MKPLVIALILASASHSGARADSLGDELSRIINERARVVLKETPLFGGRVEFKPNLLLIPSFVALDVDFLEGQALPKTPSIGTNGIEEKMLSALSEVEIGTVSVSTNEKKQLDEANKLLYDDVDSKTKSSALTKYEEFSREYESLLQQINNEQNPARQTNLRNRLARVDRDWSTFGRKFEIERALELTRDSGSSDTQTLLDDLMEKLESKSFSPAIDDILRTAAGTSWVKVLETDDYLRSIEISIEVDGERSAIASGFSQLEFSLTISPFSSDPFSHALFSKRDWRLKNGQSFSDGIAGNVSGNEIIPEYLSGVVLVSDIRLSAPQNVVSRPDSGFTNLTSHGAYMQGNALKLPAYYIAGVLIVQTPRLPDTSQNIEWE